MEKLYGDSQHAFRKSISSTSALIHIHDAASMAFDDKSCAGFAILSLDFSKAFDRVNHSVLFNKLQASGIPKEFILWLKDYLTDRSIQVRLQGKLTPSHTTKIGVPQGSVLGPSLFCALVGDFPSRMNEITTVQLC